MESGSGEIYDIGEDCFVSGSNSPLIVGIR